jgi:hypothetical protein
MGSDWTERPPGEAGMCCSNQSAIISAEVTGGLGEAHAEVSATRSPRRACLRRARRLDAQRSDGAAMHQRRILDHVERDASDHMVSTRLRSPVTSSRTPKERVDGSWPHPPGA